MSVSLAALQSEFAALYPLARAIVCRRLRVALERSDDDATDEAIAFAWASYEACRGSFDDPRRAVCLAARAGASRVLRGSSFVGRSTYHRLDALAAAGSLACDPACPVPPDDTPVVSMGDMLDALPADLHACASLLSQGLKRVEIAQRLGVSNATISRQCERIRQTLALAGFGS